jgi:hypothetical protein
MTLYAAGVAPFTKAAVASGDAFVVTLSASDTAAYAAGIYQWIERVAKASEKYNAAAGWLEVRPDIATASGNSLQLEAEKLLAVVTAAISGRLTADQQSYTIGNRQVTKIPITELLSLRAMLLRTIAAYRSPGVVAPHHEIRFGPIS